MYTEITYWLSVQCHAIIFHVVDPFKNINLATRWPVLCDTPTIGGIISTMKKKQELGQENYAHKAGHVEH